MLTRRNGSSKICAMRSPTAPEPNVLLAILATPPLTTSGERTRRRLDLAAGILGCATVEIVNLIAVPTPDVLAIHEVGAVEVPWLAARGAIAEGLDRADEVLFGWGCALPAGPARRHHRAQVEWLAREARARGIEPWMVGETPRHPSRWQRHTTRAFPEMSFDQALPVVLRRSTVLRTGLP